MFCCNLLVEPDECCFLLNMCYYCVNVYLLLLNELVTYINKGLYFHDFYHTKIHCSCAAFHPGEQATVLNIYIDQHSFQHPMLVTSIPPASHAGPQHPTSIPCWSPASHQHSMLVTSIPAPKHNICWSMLVFPAGMISLF